MLQNENNYLTRLLGEKSYFSLGDHLKNVWLVSSDRPSVEMKKIRFLVGRPMRSVGKLNKDFQYLHKCMILVMLLALQIHTYKMASSRKSPVANFPIDHLPIRRKGLR